MSSAATCAVGDLTQTIVDAERSLEFTGLLDFQVAVELGQGLGIHVLTFRDQEDIQAKLAAPYG